MAGAGELGDRLIGAAIGALELQSIYVGRRLGLYERFRPDGDELERMMDSVERLFRLDSQGGLRRIGTVLRESTVRDLARDAGFGTVTVSDLDAGFFRLYVLTA